MSDTERVNRSRALNSLFVQLGKLEGGESSIGDFNTWFTKARWDDRIFASSELTSLVWAIDTLLLDYLEDEDDLDRNDLALDVRDAIARVIAYPDRIHTTGTTPVLSLPKPTPLPSSSERPRLHAVGDIHNRVERHLEWESTDLPIAV